MTRRIHLWSGPRNLSTAMMYSWRSRADTTVVDEPLYAYYLATSGREHPGGADVMAQGITDGDRVVAEVLAAPYDTPLVVFKQMAKHLGGLDRSFLAGTSSVILTRDPFDMLTSLQVQLPDATMADTGYDELVGIASAAVAGGVEPIVVETRTLLADPPAVLAELCARLDVPYDPAMLSWPSGPKPEDGVWAPHWYDGVWRSTGWQPYKPKGVELLPHLESVLAQCQQRYAELVPYRIDGV